MDVFNFGIILMEFLTKRRPTGLSEEDDLPISLPATVEKALANGMEGLVNIVDPMLTMDATKVHVDVLARLFKLSLSCSLPNLEDRLCLYEASNSKLVLLSC